jgi:UDP-N-acetylmuramate dehydrogenase
VNIKENVNLANYSTMRLGGSAKWLAQANSENDIVELLNWAKIHNTPYIMIGQGSNIVWKDEGFPGLVIVNKILGREILKKDEDGLTLRIGAGEVWDDIVAWTVEKGYSGIEFLSRIPGTVGAAPVQNIGAYGSELSETLIEVEAYDTQTQAFEGILKQGCDFGYRSSRFKKADKGRFMITAIVLKLNKRQPTPPFYESLESYFKDHGIKSYTPAVIREAVTAIRKIKLPDPSVVNNNGSFFTNPIIDKTKFDRLLANYPDIKGWPHDNQVKLSAGWLVEKAGFSKDMHDDRTGIATWKGSALVVVNERARHTADLLTFKQKIVGKVKEMFGVTLEQEPELLP